MNMEASAHDLYLRHNNKDSTSRIQHHRVWDAGKFLESQDQIAKKDGGSITVVPRKTYLESIAKDKK